MKKVRSNARWNELTKEQRDRLETWLFEYGMGFEEAWRRAGEELGFKGSVSSVKRFFGRRSQERVLERLVETQEDAEAIAAAPATAALFRSASLKLMGQLLLRQVRDTPGEVKEWSALAKLMLWHEDIELRRQLKQEENAIRRENLAFAKERFRFNVVRRAEKALPQLQELAEARKDPKLEEYEENKHINAIARAIFEEEMPKRQLYPENAEEEAAMNAEKAEAESEKREQRAEAEAKAARDRQECYEQWVAQREVERPRTGTGNEEAPHPNPLPTPASCGEGEDNGGRNIDPPSQAVARPDTEHEPRHPMSGRVGEGKTRKRTSGSGEEKDAKELANQAAARTIIPETKRPKGRPTCTTDEEWSRQHS